MNKFFGIYIRVMVHCLLNLCFICKNRCFSLLDKFNCQVRRAEANVAKKISINNAVSFETSLDFLRLSRSLIAVVIFQSLILNLHAQTINARFTTSIYSWEQRESESESASHLRAYQLAQISIGNLGLSGLSFHSYLNLSHDFSEKAVADPRLWIYNCYLNFKTFANTTNISVGRQRIYAGIGYGTIDGLQVKYRFKDYFKAKVYIGTLAPLRRSYKIEEFNSDNFSWGIHITSTKFKKFRLGLSYAHHSRMVVRYSSAGIFTGNYRLDHPVSALQKQLIGLDISSILTSKIRLNGRLDYNLATRSVKRGEGGMRFSLNKDFELGLDYIFRRPYIDFNSIFWVFGSNPSKEVAFHGNYRWNSYRFYMNVSTVIFDEENTLRFGTGCSWRSIYLGYFHRSGYGGDSDGFNANFRFLVKKKLNLVIGANFASYRLFSSANKKDQLFGGSLGMIYRANNKLSLQTDIQFLNNKLFDQDLRFFFRGSYAFFHRIKS